MATRVNMEEVRGFRDETRTLCREIRGDLQAIRRALEAMGQMRGFSGQAADQTNRYVRTFHLTIVKTFDSLFTDLLVKLNQDIQAFHREVDTASRTQINRQALLELREDIQDDYRQFYRGYERARDSLLEVFDISGVKVPAIKDVSQDKGATREYISEVLDDLKGFDRRKKPRQIESVLDQLRKTLNQTKKLPAPLRAGHYQKLVTQGGLDGFNIYSNIVGRNPETRHVHGQLDALGIRPDPIPFKVFSFQGIEALLAKRDQVQLVQAYVSDKMWDDFIDTLKEAAPSYKALGVSIWEGVQTRGDQKFDSVGDFANWLTYGIPKGILDANKANYEVMREKTNAYTVTNFLTLGTVDMVVGTFNPETPLSAEHLLDSFGVVSMVYGGAAAVKQVGGVATVKPITTLNTPIKPGPTGKQLIGSGGNPQRLSLWQEIQQNVELSKRARQSSNFKSYVKKEQVVLNGGKQVSGAKLTVETTTNSKIPTVHKPNSVIRRVNSNGNLISERIFDDVGKVITDIHYTDHGNPKMHPKVPHKHHWDWSDPNKPKPSK